MSLVIQGDIVERDRLCSWILDYKKLCDGLTADNRAFSNDTSIQHQISNKYYTALLTVLLKDFNAMRFSEDEGEAIEGYILVPSKTKTDLNAEFYKFSKDIADADVGLRLLITFENASTETDPVLHEQYFNWSLDNNFEHIVIDSSNLLDTRDQREKSGLPRLMEALESNMWSTMKRQKAPAGPATPNDVTAPESGSSAGTYVPPQPTISSSAPAPTSVFSELVAKATDDSTVQPPRSKTDEEELAEREDKIASDLLLDSLKSSLPEEKDYESFDQLSNLIEQAKSFREKAAGGSLSDADRRKQAAEFALKLSAMMSLGDDESDSEDD